MATLPTTMPVEVTTTGTATVVTDQIINLRLIQWIDDAVDIENDSECDITVNGVTLHSQIQMKADELSNVVAWEIGPFNPGIPVKGLTVATLTHGAVQIWYD